MFETARNGGMQLVASSKESSLIRNNVQQQRVCCENIDSCQDRLGNSLVCKSGTETGYLMTARKDVWVAEK